MSEMVERVAKAIAFARRHKHDASRDAEHHWGCLHEDTQRYELQGARAAIAAMREPTEQMLAAGMQHEATDLASEYRAMIDAALATSR